MNKDVLAFDKATVRKKDQDGKLHIAISHITKAMVCPYFGHEIPNHKDLGLDANTVYNLLRDPNELEKAAHTFNKLPILSKHEPVFVGLTDQDFKPYLIGFSGDDSVYNEPYVDNSLVIYDSVAIAAIEQSVQKEISCGYRYTPVMTKGVYDGVKYDGVMTEIIGNHIAIVESGRAGSDVVVGDSNPFLEIDMSKKSAKIASAVLDGIKGNLAQDSKLTIVDIEQLVKVAMDAEKDDEPEKVAKDAKEQQDGESDEDYKKRMAEDEDDKDEDDKVSKTAMDSAINAALDANAKIMHAKFTALRQAESDVRTVIGEVVAQDSAEDVYKLALSKMDADLTGVDKTAYRSLFLALKKATSGKKPTIAKDSAEKVDTLGNVQKLIGGRK
jgi:hypothetical protein